MYSPHNEHITNEYLEFFPIPENPRTLKDKYFLFRCEDGWYGLIETCCKVIKDHLKKNPNVKFYFTQIKQKFGGLNLHYEGGDDFIKGVIEAMEAHSYSVCEETGRPGCLYSKPNGWLQTLCPEKAVGFTKYVIRKTTDES